jgi:hypothetical protein
MTTNQLPIIILVDERDDITHTAEWPQCKDLTCPCHAGDPDDLWEEETDGEWVNGDEEDPEDEISDRPPSEAELDRQEQTAGPRRIDWNKIFA